MAVCIYVCVRVCVCEQESKHGRVHPQVCLCQLTNVQWSVKTHTSGFQRIRIFISSTLRCASPKQRPCGDTQRLNYSLLRFNKT